MRKFTKIIILILFVVALGLSMTATPVYATDYNVDINNYSSFGLSKNLFETFCAMSNELNGKNRRFFDCRLFSSSGIIDETTGTSEEASRIRNDIKSGLLNLSRGDGAYECIKNISGITSIGVMPNMLFDGIRILNLDGNLLTNVGANSFASFDDLEALSAQDNNIYSFDMGSDYYGLIDELDLSGNLLSKVDLDCMATGGTVDLSNNRLEKVSDMSFGEFDLGSLNLSFNNLTGVMNIDQITSVCSVKPMMNVQGVSRDRFVAGDEITIYNDDETTGLMLNISYDSNSKYSGDIVHTSGLSGFSKIIMPAGRLYFAFSYDVLPAGCDASLISSKRVNIYLPTPVYYTTCNGVVSQAVQYEKDFTLTINGDNIDNIPNKALVDREQVLSIYSGKKLEGNVFSITRNGSFSLTANVSFDSLDSETLSVTVTKRDTTLITIGIIIVVAIVIVSVSGVSLFRFFRDGGQVAPLNSREIQSIRRRENRKYGNEYDFDTEDYGIESTENVEETQDLKDDKELTNDEFYGESDDDNAE